MRVDELKRQLEGVSDESTVMFMDEGNAGIYAVKSVQVDRPSDADPLNLTLWIMGEEF